MPGVRFYCVARMAQAHDAAVDTCIAPRGYLRAPPTGALMGGLLQTWVSIIALVDSTPETLPGVWAARHVRAARTLTRAAPAGLWTAPSLLEARLRAARRPGAAQEDRA